MPKKLSIAELNKLYTQANEADREVFAEQRSNCLLISGEHYTKKASKIYNRVRESRDLSDNQRLRLTKNHIHKIYRHYVANILSYAPGVAVLPKKDAELQDQKAAELNQAVWEDAKIKHRMSEKTRNWAGDFCGIGEVACKVFFDPNRGELKGYQAKMQEDDKGEPILDENGQQQLEIGSDGQPVSDMERPVFSGDFVFESLFAFNILRAPGCKSMSESPYLIVRKMVSIDDLKSLYADNPEKLKFIQASKDDTFIVFDSAKSEYAKTKDQTMVREYYWKPCYQYPKGYFQITTSLGILDEEELPYGIFPIVWQGFEEYPTAPRGRSPVKQWRPFQAEINRASSQVAQHQVTLSDDKILYQGGTKLAPGALLPGVRGITFNGVIPPTILPGRTGDQYLPYIESQVQELYDIAEMQEENEQAPAQVDAYSMLFTSMKRLKKFAIYGEKFEQFLMDLCQLYLELARYYLPDDRLIYAVGKAEQINIKEFRSTTKLCYEIKLEPRNETLETQLGKQLTFNHILQYVGPNLDKDDIGKLIRQMPFSNSEEGFDDFTIDYDMVRNDFLAMERGETPQVTEIDNHEYIVKKTVSRMKKPDFKFLPPQIQQLYQQYKQQHEQVVAKQAQDLIDAKNQYVPISGSMIACDMYVPDPIDPSRAAKRVRIPYQSLDWLIQKLDAQNTSLQKLETMNKGVVSDLLPMVGQPKPNNQQQQQPMAPSMPSSPDLKARLQNALSQSRVGPASPIGVS